LPWAKPVSREDRAVEKPPTGRICYFGQNLHPEVLRGIALDHAIVPRRIPVSIAERGERLGEAVGHGVVGEVGDEAEGIVVDYLGAKGAEGGLNRGICLLNHVAPSRDTASVGAAEIFCRNGGDVLGVNVGDEDVRGAGVQEGFDRSCNLG
jgi:hypothetical protein